MTRRMPPANQHTACAPGDLYLTAVGVDDLARAGGHSAHRLDSFRSRACQRLSNGGRLDQAPTASLGCGFSKATCSPKQRTRLRWPCTNCRSSSMAPELAHIASGRASTQLLGGSSVDPLVVTSQM